jgi:thiosulfate/3-mercaptopyruvate sulfurtransferase
MKNYLFLILFVCINLINIAKAENAFPGPLINADWLVNHIDDVVVLDTRKELETFVNEGHIENAILVDVNKIRIEREIDGKKLTRMRPDATSFQHFMRKHGINNNSHVVISHRGIKPGHIAAAARLYWHMKYYGFNNVALLNGGNAAWVAALEDLTSDTVKVAAGNYNVGPEHPEMFATMQQVKDAINNNAVTLIDTRALRFHIGIDKKDYVFAYGHIPGSRNLPYKFLNPAKGIAVFFSADKLRDIIDNLRIDMGTSLILYCNSAYECSSDWFVLHEILGHKDVRIYDGSLHQWTQYDANPMTRKITK